MLPKWWKSTDHDPNLISSEGGQDPSAHHISGHSSLVFSWECPETTNLTSFTKSKCHQNKEDQQTVTKILSVEFWRWSGYISTSNFRPFLLWGFKEMPGNLSRWTDGWRVGWSVNPLWWVGSLMDGWTDRWTDRQKDGWTTGKHNASGT